MSESKAALAHAPLSPSAAPARDVRSLGVTVNLVRPACFRGDERLRCRDTACRWRGECRRLVAEWKR